MTEQLSKKLSLAIDSIVLSINDLMEIKDKNRSILGDYLSAEVVNYNGKEVPVRKKALTYLNELSGGFSGRVVLNLDEPLAISIASSLFMDELTVVDETVDAAMNELLNIFSGNLTKHFYQYNIDLELALQRKEDYDFMHSKSRRKVLFRYNISNSLLQFILEVD
jgi:CheY-specific phosphatase CheX